MQYVFDWLLRDENATHAQRFQDRVNALVATTQKLSPTIIKDVEKTAFFFKAMDRWVELLRNLVEKCRLDLSNATPEH